MAKRNPRIDNDDLRATVLSRLKSLESRGVRAVHYPDGIPDRVPAYVSEDAPQNEIPTVLTESAARPEPSPLHQPIDEDSPVTQAASLPKTLKKLEEMVSQCTDCALHESRTNAVFGVGNTKAKVMFIGEAPGRDEDLKGEPFVGRSGQLLTKILAAIDLKREDVYIANILKCRPPSNRDPQESEVRCCEKYLIAQIKEIKPKYICALGRISAQWLLQTNASLGTLRAGVYHYQGIRVLPTYHPAALLRNPNFKRPCWEDFKKLKKLLDAA